MYRNSLHVLKVKVLPGKANMGDLARSLGPYGIQIKDFVDAFNKKTINIKHNNKVIVKIYIDSKKKFTFKVALRSVSSMIKEVAKIEKGSNNPGKEIIGHITSKDVQAIAEEKMPDMGCADLDKVVKTVRGTAFSMGIEVRNE